MKSSLGAASLVLLAACSGSTESTTAPSAAKSTGPAPVITQKEASTFFKAVAPIPVTIADQPKVDLGRMLFYETRLSATQTQSCNSCHKLDHHGVDNEPTSLGAFGERGGRNSPSVYYAFGNLAQFWDGRAATLADQAMGPPLNPIEMAMPDAASIEKLLGTIPGYVAAFKAAFPNDPNPITFAHVAEAIASFESHLVTPSPFDAWLNGDNTALDQGQLQGLKTFIDTGCIACHSGPTVGGQMYQKLGVVHPFDTKDEGRKAVTGNETDLHVFKVPSLRNVRDTAPYFHDGSVTTLPEAIKLMAHHQLGKELSDADTNAIAAFLTSLSGTPDTAYIAKPALPESGPTTPGPLPKPG